MTSPDARPALTEKNRGDGAGQPPCDLNACIGKEHILGKRVDGEIECLTCLHARIEKIQDEANHWYLLYNKEITKREKLESDLAEALKWLMAIPHPEEDWEYHNPDLPLEGLSEFLARSEKKK